MPYAVDFKTVSTVGLESSPVADALHEGTETYWSADRRAVECVSCHSGPATEPTDVAGGSAWAEYERRSERKIEKKRQSVIEDQERRRQRAERRPLVGRIANAVTPEVTTTPASQATKAWATAAAGEERVAEVLAGVPGIEVLDDRRVPGSRTNIGHIVVGPVGVLVIDAKKYRGSGCIPEQQRRISARKCVRTWGRCPSGAPT